MLLILAPLYKWNHNIGRVRIFSSQTAVKWLKNCTHGEKALSRVQTQSQSKCRVLASRDVDNAGQRADISDWDFFRLTVAFWPLHVNYDTTQMIRTDETLEETEEKEKSPDSSKHSRSDYFSCWGFKINVCHDWPTSTAYPAGLQRSDDDVQATQSLVVTANLCFHSYKGRLRKPAALNKDRWRSNDIIRNRAALWRISQLLPQAP